MRSPADRRRAQRYVFATPLSGVITPMHAVDISDISRSGCRFEAAQLLPVGAVGMLSVTIAGEQHLEMFRVSRANPLSKDDHVYEIGIEFLPHPVDRASLHDIVVQLDDLDSIS